MSTKQVADQLIEMCRKGENIKAVEQLYADNCKSIEMPEVTNQIISGKQAIIKKTQDWFNSVQEIHSGHISDPLVAGNFFTCTMVFDVTFKERGRINMEEVCIYEVENGKIISEQFFYTI